MNRHKAASLLSDVASILLDCATGAEIWPGKIRYPIKFPKSFMDALLAHF